MSLSSGALPWAVVAQPSPEELAPLLAGLEARPQLVKEATIERRVPLMTDDPTVAPLIDLQVFAPPVVPKNGESCTVTLLNHTFGDGSFNAPAIVDYVPPTEASCGEVGKWATISMNLSVFSIGTQYDRLGAIYLSHSEIWRTSSAEPTKTGTIWNTIKDVTHFAPLFSKPGDLMMDFSNIIAPDLLLDGVFNVILSATFYAPTKTFPAAATSDTIIPLSNLDPTLPNFFAISDDIGGVTNVTLPSSAVEAYVEVFCSGNSAEEFWYLSKIQIHRTSSCKTFLNPRVSSARVHSEKYKSCYGAYDQPTYWVDITPFIPILLDEETQHAVTLRAVGQGIDAPSFNFDWFVSGSIHVRMGTSKTTVQGNATVWTKVVAHRELRVESELFTSQGKRTVSFAQSLDYTNTAQYADAGWIQWGQQSTVGTTVANHQGKQVLRDAFSYPLSVFSNYSLFEEEFGGYGSEINQTHIRALQPPIGTYRAIQSIQHARGQIGMDNWPGLRHAINGTGATDQTFAICAFVVLHTVLISEAAPVGPRDGAPIRGHSARLTPRPRQDDFDSLVRNLTGQAVTDGAALAQTLVSQMFGDNSSSTADTPSATTDPFAQITGDASAPSMTDSSSPTVTVSGDPSTGDASIPGSVSEFTSAATFTLPTGIGSDADDAMSLFSQVVGAIPTSLPSSPVPGVSNGGFEGPGVVPDGTTIGNIPGSPMSDCAETYTVVEGDTCDAVCGVFNLAFVDFLRMNPTVGAACMNLQIGQQYCVQRAYPQHIGWGAAGTCQGSGSGQPGTTPTSSVPPGGLGTPSGSSDSAPSDFSDLPVPPTGSTDPTLPGTSSKSTSTSDPDPNSSATSDPTLGDTSTGNETATDTSSSPTSTSLDSDAPLSTSDSLDASALGDTSSAAATDSEALPTGTLDPLSPSND
ncbi:Peptide-n4-(N-acetyl-beta-glucosaminyl)asparagine amidase a [Mycena venus]|uniref:Peptide-n4-(N-acetyl-beta-glucosaminyl)asparagine amidase a n=1 Tax=Mycena venus TaxID=2733690 RepID=A0A8H6XGP4_9AGAR|nr:Peptide-n4-(N-acetyl-beta-glucosaminyl)asparagine amidase a [Mycena venus]